MTQDALADVNPLRFYETWIANAAERIRRDGFRNPQTT